MTEHERLLQGAVNLVRMLETIYKTDIKNTRDYLILYDQWHSMGKPLNVALIASQGVKKVRERQNFESVQWVDNWDFKENPIKWDDLLE